MGLFDAFKKPANKQYNSIQDLEWSAWAKNPVAVERLNRYREHFKHVDWLGNPDVNERFLERNKRADIRQTLMDRYRMNQNEALTGVRSLKGYKDAEGNELGLIERKKREKMVSKYDSVVNELY